MDRGVPKVVLLAASWGTPEKRKEKLRRHQTLPASIKEKETHWPEVP
jgi:hypothetical protein